MPIPNDKDLIELISELHDIAAEGSQDAWEGAYAKIAKVTNARRGALNVWFASSGEYRTLGGTLPDEFTSSYNEFYHSVNPFKRAIAQMKTGERLNRREAMADEYFRKTDFYNDYYQNFDAFHFEHAVLGTDGGVACGLSLIRSEREGNFSKTDIKVLQCLMPHLQRAFRFYFQISAIKRQHDVLTEAIERIPRGVLAVDADHNIIFVNTTAETMLRDGTNGLAAKQARLSASSHPNNRKLKVAIGHALDPNPLVRPNEIGLVKIDRPENRLPLQVFVAPVQERHFRLDSGNRLALVIITDPEQTFNGAGELLTELYALTAAEAVLATMIADGKTLHEASDTLGVSLDTVRTHLKHIFAKTGTKRQADLIKLIVMGPASLRTKT